MTGIYWKAAYHFLEKVECHNTQKAYSAFFHLQLFSEHLLHAYYMPGIVLQALFLAVHNTNKVLLLMNLHSSWSQKKIKKCLTSHVVIYNAEK